MPIDRLRIDRATFYLGSHRLRTWLNYFSLYLQTRRLFALSALLVIATSVITIETLITGQNDLALASAAVLLVSILLLLLDQSRWRKDREEILVTEHLDTELGDCIPSPQLQAWAYRIDSLAESARTAALCSDPVNHLLRAGADAQVVRERGRFVASRTDRRVRWTFLNQRFRTRSQLDYAYPILLNQRKVRLESDLHQDGATLADVQIRKTSYFESLKTSDLAMKYLRQRSDGSKFFDGTDMYLDERGCVRDLGAANPASCHYGANTIAITKDNKLVIIEQGGGSATAPGQLAPSGSGSADWHKDAKRGRGLREMVLCTAVRELSEECGISRSAVRGIEITGYCRVLYRSGLPSFFCAAKLSAEAADLRVTRPERKFVALHLPLINVSDGASLGLEIAQLNTEYSNRLSVPLRWALFFLEETLVADRGLEARLFERLA
jgi:hypothetical protein